MTALDQRVLLIEASHEASDTLTHSSAKNQGAVCCLFAQTNLELTPWSRWTTSCLGDLSPRVRAKLRCRLHLEVDPVREESMRTSAGARVGF